MPAFDTPNTDVAGMIQGAALNQQKLKINDIAIKQGQAAAKKQAALDEIQRTSIYAKNTVLPMLEAGDTEGLRQNLIQRIDRLDQQGIDSSGSRKALEMLKSGNLQGLRDVSSRVIQTAQDYGVMPKQYANITDAQGNVVAQREGGIGGKEIATPRPQTPALKPSRDRINAQTPDGKVVAAIKNEKGQLIDPITGKPQPTWIIAPKKQVVGTPSDYTKSQAGKRKAELETNEISLRNNFDQIGRLEQLVTSKDYIGGATGNLVSLLNSGVAQLRQAAGKNADLVSGKKLDESIFRVKGEGAVSKEVMGRFRRAAITHDREESAVMQLAYVLAKSLNPDGRISDADVREAERILGSGADPASRMATLEDVKKRMLSSYNNEGTVKYGKDFTPITWESLTGTAGQGGSSAAPGAAPAPTAAPAASDEASKMLRDAGLQ